ncbi:unnamed protein product [Blepharisma stoltei]|uniref:Uncharacterized protein n=1 Tax=Blepharisma stoltei TaxID=1481888 RepID=A0AAU9K3N8_9CILI|nr:unnamed protein product [Blepharisma stoltei]
MLTIFIMDNILQSPANITDKARILDEKYKLSAVGCLVHFLKTNGHSTFESLVDYIKLKKDELLTTKGGKFSKPASGIANYVLGWYPKIFLVNSQLRYYLDEEEAAKHELEFKNKEANKQENDNFFPIHSKREDEASIQRRKAMKRIRFTIESDLKKSREEYSPITKAYLVLTSYDNEAITDLKKLIRKTYTELILSKNF